MQTETIDQLFLELSQVTQAKTKRERALEAVLIEVRDRLRAHPEYAELTPEREEEVGGDTAEFSYLVRTINEALENP